MTDGVIVFFGVTGLLILFFGGGCSSLSIRDKESILFERILVTIGLISLVLLLLAGVRFFILHT